MKVDFWGQEFEVNMVVGCIGGFIIAVVSSMFGFGGGPFMVPLMSVALRLPMYLVVGSSLLAIFFSTTVSSVRHYQFGNFDLYFFLAMFPAAILGGYIAPQIAKRVSPLVVKRIACVGLVVLALNLLGVY
ncbi:sulfite exporter TauE/SafE family protein [uncultured Desulfobulbus sp.]|uniref:sulfite exporter TauE/SafE family protein n=1 Tax=uncultured Desulfobulbus sp. TaxID=239745 RepID=UPI002D1E3677|nr:sulfite exporter TauE/SafE family protein [uncultured Desulfobulbus sp.]